MLLSAWLALCPQVLCFSVLAPAAMDADEIKEITEDRARDLAYDWGYVDEPKIFESLRNVAHRFDDADIENAVNCSIAGIFGATGQSCVAGSRLYLQENIADEFLSSIVKQAKNIKIGDPLLDETQMGPLCTKGQLENIKTELAFAVEEGATLLCGGKSPEGLGELFFEPTIVDCPSQKLKIVDTELFGPVLSVIKFKTEEEVISLANDTKHGLAAGIFSKSNSRCLRVSKAIHAGIVWVNTYRVVSPIAEFGGFKNSGYGRESGFQAIYDYTRPKTVWMNMSDEPAANPFVMK